MGGRGSRCGQNVGGSFLRSGQGNGCGQSVGGSHLMSGCGGGCGKRECISLKYG